LKTTYPLGSIFVMDSSSKFQR